MRTPYRIYCAGCERATPPSTSRGGFCPECKAVADRDAPIALETTPAMLIAGAETLQKFSAENDLFKVGQVFRAMLRAMPLEQKRVMLNNPLFEVAKRVFVDTVRDSG